ncbi:alpha-L-fucosidase [Bacteroides sedimenti]|uniref:alpha-L-fucosidase n=1 Tax=Bacteroides sedimenti TaxID=2136147 RepID=A0ABN6Z7D8_9BACE
MRKLVLATVLLLVCAGSLLAQRTTAKPPKPYGALPSAGQVKWHEMEMYAFIHFSINTFTNKEWGYGDESPTLFNPTDFDADAIASIVKSAGLKGIVLTCKHHDGFCLWPTKTTEHNISKSPWKNGKGDMVKEFSDACKRHGLKFGVYLSPWDRNNKDYGKPEYIKTYRAQYRELLTNYGPVFESWHDGANGGDGYYGGSREARYIDKATYYDWDNTWKILSELHPNAVIFSDIGPGCRWVGNEKGYAKDPCWSTITFEPEDPNQKLCPGISIKNLENGTHNGKQWVPAEVDFSIRPGWFWHESENGKVKTAAQLLDHYFLSVGRGANMILNIPPDRRGHIYETDAASLAEFGRLVKQMFAVNYAKGAIAKASNVRGKSAQYAASQVLDGSRYTYWATDDKVKNADLTLQLKGKKSFNVIKIRENIKLGHRVNKWAVDVMQDGKWQEYASGVAIGSCRLIRGKKVTTDRVRLRIIDADACPCIGEFGLYAEPQTATETPVANKKSENYKKSWKVVSSNQNIKDAALAIDGDSKTFSTLPSGADAALTVDMGAEAAISGFCYVPRQDRSVSGIIDQYVFKVSKDGINWEKAAEGEFSNIKNNPIEQLISFPGTIKARYIQLVPVRTLDGGRATVAELGIVSAIK